MSKTSRYQKLNRNSPYQSTNPVLSHSPACAGPITHAWSTKPYFWWTQGELHCEADAQRHAIQGAIEHHGLKSAISHEGYQTTIGWFLLIRFFFGYISILIGENGRVADLSMTFALKDVKFCLTRCFFGFNQPGETREELCVLNHRGGTAATFSS